MDATTAGDDLRLLCNGTSWDLAAIQGLWTTAQYLRLTDHARQLIEFTDGRLEPLPMPTDRHQTISRFLFLAVVRVVERLGGVVLYAPLRLRIREGKFREPDILLLLDANDPRRQDDFWTGADFVMEVVSPGNPGRDIRDKRLDYAEAGIPEYWIVNPIDETATVLTLAADGYVEQGVYPRGAEAPSVLLRDFSVAVADIFDAE